MAFSAASRRFFINDTKLPCLKPKMKTLVFALLLLANFCQADENPPKVLTHKEIAVQILEDLRMIDAATDQFAIENNLKIGEKVTSAQIRLYIKKGTRLYDALGRIFGVRDSLGNLLGPFVVGQGPKLSEATFYALCDVADAKFWGPYMFVPKPLSNKEEK